MSDQTSVDMTKKQTNMDCRSRPLVPVSASSGQRHGTTIDITTQVEGERLQTGGGSRENWATAMVMEDSKRMQYGDVIFLDILALAGYYTKCIAYG